MVNAYLLTFIINACQVGVGIHGFQRIIYENAKQDSWIAVILSFIIAHLVVFIMLKTLEMYKDEDLYGIHNKIFGKYFGNLLNLLYAVYCSVAFFSILINYVEVISTWVFPYLSSMFLSISLLLIVIYSFVGGFRVVIGVTFFSF